MWRQREDSTHLRIPLVWCLVSWQPQFQCKTMWSLTGLQGIKQRSSWITSPTKSPLFWSSFEAITTTLGVALHGKKIRQCDWLYLYPIPAPCQKPQYILPSPYCHTSSGWHANSSHMLTCSNHSPTKQSARRCGQLNPQKTQAQEAIKILNIALFQILPFKPEPEWMNERPHALL